MTFKLRIAFFIFELAWLLCGSGYSDVIEFIQDNCPPCERMKPVVERMRKGGWAIDEVNISRRADSRCVGGTPQFVVTDINGKVVGRKVGACSFADLLAFLRDITKQSEQPQFRVTVPPNTSEQWGWSAVAAMKESQASIADEWFGKPVTFPQVATVTITEFRTNSGGGSTSFGFDSGECIGPITSRIFGTPENIIADVIPHEVHHMVFAQHYGKAVPRWADEGTAILEERFAEQQLLHHAKLVDGMRRGTAIPLSRLLFMKEYPSDMEQMLMLYAQGWSLSDFLVQHAGKRHFAQFLGELMQSIQPELVFEKHYGFADLSALNDAWLDWFKHGSPRSPKDELVTTNFRPMRWDCRLRQWVPCGPPTQPPMVAVPRQPQQTPSIPNAVPQSPAKGCECDPTLTNRVKELEAKIAAAEASIESGQFAGKPGRDGVDGKDGKDGATPEIDYDKIAAKVAAEIKPAEIDYDQLAKEVAKRLPPSPVSYDIRPRKQ